MGRLAGVCAIVTGSVAVLAGLVNLSWWVNPQFGAYSSYAVMFTAFMVGFLGWFVMFGMLVYHARDSRSRRDASAKVLALVPGAATRLLVIGLVLALVFAPAVVGAVDGNAQTGGWGIDQPYGWHHCHWPLTTDHDSKHLCVSHERYLAVDKGTNRTFVAFGIGMLAIDTLVFTLLSRAPRSKARPRTQRPVVAHAAPRAPFPPPRGKIT
jgi:hypothetical protein